MVRAGLEVVISRFQFQHPDRSATLPPTINIIEIHSMSLKTHLLDVCLLYTDIKIKGSKLSANSTTNIIGLVYQSPHPPPLGTLWS